MQVYYRGNPIGEVFSINEGKKMIVEYQENNYTHFSSLINKSKELIKESLSIRKKKLNELQADYIEAIKKENPKFFEELEILGKDFYEDDFIDIFFLKAEDELFGFIIKDGQEQKKTTIGNLGIKACNKFALSKYFEIKE